MKLHSVTRPAKLGRLGVLLAALAFSVFGGESEAAQNTRSPSSDAGSTVAPATPTAASGMDTTPTQQFEGHAATKNPVSGDGSRVGVGAGGHTESARSASLATLFDDVRMARWLEQQPGFPAGVGVRTNIEMLPANGRQKLAACKSVEYVLPAGARLWGRVNVGIRCTDGARWTYWQPALIRVHGPALVSRHALSAGASPRPDDFLVQDIEWTQQSGVPAGLDTPLSAYDLQRPLAAGQPLRADHLRTRPAVRSGEQVTAIAEGDGFRISVDAIALANAGEGQTIRVRTTNGKVLSGKIEGKTVKIFR
ncbi:MAG: flagellar basal body P-ring formation chaperone FlgA [Lautropia sp.]|nr:flagellar basal body P-ring formation chaperone FlgA [Lautropia sp.]